MNTLSLAALAQFALSCPSYSKMPTDGILERVLATAQVESSLVSTALHDNTTQRSYLPETDAEATSLAVTLLAQGHSIDAGLMQINDANWSRLGLTVETVFEPRRNVCAGVDVLAEAYAAERRVSCRYNTGRPDCAIGYPERIAAALRRVRAEGAAATPTVLAPRDIPAEPVPTNPFVGHGSVREMMFAPSFRPVALPSSDMRPTIPAVPDHSIAAPERGGGRPITMRSVAP